MHDLVLLARLTMVCGEGAVLQVPALVEDYYDVARKGIAKL